MVKRVLLGPNSAGTNGLFISKPGFDVTTATSDQMIFDSRLGYYGSVVASGQANAGQTVTFPTMPYVPLAFITLWNGTGVTGSMMYTRNKTAGELNGAYSGSQTVQVPYYKITNSSLIIIQPTWYNDANTAIQNYTVRYIIWRCPGA
jgi:hypothetical protein